MARAGPTDPIDIDRLRDELRRVLADVVRDVDDVIHHAHPSPASLHRLHREMRRLRTALGIWRELLGAAGQAEVRPLAQRVRRLTRLVGQVRDRDVTLGLLEGVTDRTETEEEREELQRIRSRLADDARTGRELLRAFLRSERQAHLFELVGEAFDLPPRARSSTELARLLADHQHVGHAKVVSAHKKARRRPTMDRLHRLRIRVRRLRQISELASAVDPEHDPAVAESLRRLQQNLGRLHDLDVLLQDLDPAFKETSWTKVLRRERRRQRKSIAKSLKARNPPPLPEVPVAARALRPTAP
jgi:CHAD domain-containing protein